MIDKGRTLISFYHVLRSLFEPEPEKFLIVYMKDGTKIRLILRVVEIESKEFKLLKND